MADVNQTINYLVELKGKLDPTMKKVKKALDGVEDSVEKINKSKIKPNVDKSATKNLNKFKGSLSGVMDKVSSSIPILGELGPALTNPWVAAGAAIAATAVHLFNLSKEIYKVRSEVKKFEKDSNSIDEITKRLRALKLTLGEEFDEKSALEFANRISKIWKIPIEEALTIGENLELGTRGGFNPDDIGKDVLEKAKDAGVKISEAASILGGSIKEGIDPDKALEAYGEFGIKIREMTKATSDALSESGFNPVQIQKDIESGAKTQREVFNEIFSKTGLTKKQRQTLIADVAGTPAEDIGERGVAFLVKQNALISDLAAKQKDIVELNEQNKKLSEAQSKAAAPFVKSTEFLALMWSKIQTVFYEIVGPIAEMVAELVKAVYETAKLIPATYILAAEFLIIKNILIATAKILSVIAKAIRAAAKWVQYYLVKSFNNVKEIVDDIFSNDKVTQFKDAFVTAIEEIQKLWDKLSNSVLGVWDRFTSILGEGPNVSAPGSDVTTTTEEEVVDGNKKIKKLNDKIMDDKVSSSVQSEVKSIKVEIGAIQEIGVQNVNDQTVEEFTKKLQNSLQAILADTSQL